MTISRSQMGSQLTGNKMKKKPAPKFKACASCPNPAKCRAAGKCMKKK